MWEQEHRERSSYCQHENHCAYHGKLDISSEIEKGTKVRVIF